MKAIIKLSFWKLVIASLIIGVLCHLVFNWSVWATALVINFIWFAEKYSRLLYIPAIAIIGWSIFTSYLPITASKSPWATLKTDLFISKTVDSVQVKADLILEAEKNRQKNNLLGKYAVLLKQGKVEEAKAMMDSIDNLFYPQKVKEKPATVQAPAESDKSISMVKDSVFTKGTYYINVKGETPFNIVVVSSHGVECHRYSLQSPTWNYQILIPGMRPIQAGASAQLPYLQNPVFRLASQTGDTVTLIVA